MLPSIAAAQAPSASDSLPFRAGQWGAQFVVSSGAYSAGALRFRSPASAWVLDVGLDASRGTTTTTSQFGVDESRTSVVSASVQGGLRAYRPLAERVVRFHGAGLLLAYERSRGATTPGTTPPRLFRRQAAAPGAYAELGASYLVTRNLSLGASAMADVRYQRTTQTNPVVDGGTVGSYDQRDSRVLASLGNARLLATLYF